MEERGRMYPQDDLTLTIHHLTWFVDLRPVQVEELARIATVYSIQPGEFLYREGDRDDMLYILLEGQVALEMQVPTRGLVAYHTAEMLDVIGWSSMTPVVRQRVAQARVTQPGLAIAFNGKLLRQLCDEDPQIGYAVYRRLANAVADSFLTMRLNMMELIALPAGQQIH